MSILVVGASGATGRLLVRELLGLGQEVVAIVRSPERLDASLRDHARLKVITGTALDFADDELSRLVGECDAAASCLGHNITMKGMFGRPRRLVTESTARLCAAMRTARPNGPNKFVLMNTAGNANRDLVEPVGIPHRIVIGLLRHLLPPHVDNEQAADHLRVNYAGADAAVQWVVVRPDGLIDAPSPTEYDLHPSPTRDAIFNSGTTSRINVAHFMARLLTNDTLWKSWRGQMPVIYNRPQA